MSKEIFKIKFSITDYGSTYEPKQIETHSKDWKTVVKKHLKKKVILSIKLIWKNKKNAKFPTLYS